MNSVPSGRDLAQVFRALPRDELAALLELAPVLESAARHPITRRMLQIRTDLARAVLEGRHPGPAVVAWDEWIAVQNGPAVDLIAANGVAGAEEHLTVQDPP
jgi:hypothetical protein